MAQYQILASGVPLVTGRLPESARVVHSGKRRGVKYEIYYPTYDYRIQKKNDFKWYYAAVTYYPYVAENGERGVEAEVVGYGLTLEQAINKADNYIERIWKRDLHNQRRGYPSVISNPLSLNQKTALITGGIVAAVAAVWYFTSKSAAVPAKITNQFAAGAVRSTH